MVHTLLGYNYRVDQIYRVYASQDICPYALKKVGAPFYFDSEDIFSMREITSNEFVFREDFFIYGHVFFKDGFNYFPDSTNITFLRDPLKRIISHEKFWRICNQYYSDPEMCAKHLIPDGSPLETSTNLQTYYLSSYSREDRSVSMEQHLESAKLNLLNHFDFVGIVEDMDSSLEVLYKILDYALPEIPVINSSDLIELNLTEDEKLEMLKKNWADVELYNFGKELLRLKKIEISQRPRAKKSFSAESCIHFTLDQSFEGSGWGYREISSDLPGQFLRTSFTTDPYFEFPLEKKSYHLKFKITSPSKANLFNLTLRVNGTPIYLRKQLNFPWITFSGVIPEHCISEKQNTKLTFSVPELYRPADHGEILDNRLLGLSIANIEIAE